MPQALLLANSFLRAHPHAHFVILLVDAAGEVPTGPRTSILGLRDLGLAAGEEWRLPMLYDNRELTCVVKPALFLALLKTGARTVAWFHPSTLIFRPLTRLELPRGDKVIVATEAIKNEFGDSGRSFIAVQTGAEPALASWFEGQSNPSLLQKSSFDYVPHFVITSPGFALAYWNLDPGALTVSGDSYKIGAQTLRSFDFRGYDPEKPHLLSKYQGLEPRILLSENPALARLCDEYGEKLRQAARRVPQFKAGNSRILSNGLPMEARMLRLYRNALNKYRMEGAPEPPSPLGPEGEEGFLKWLNEPLSKGQPPVTRYMLAVYEDREDVREVFPDPTGADASAFYRWYLSFGRRELNLPAALLPAGDTLDEVSGAAPPSPPVIPVNVAGFFQAELGLGTAARALLAALEAAEIPFNTISFDRTASRLGHVFSDRCTDAAQPDINIVCINPDQIRAFVEQTEPALWHRRYTIGVWFWEVEDFPTQFHDAFNYVDEIWVASDFMREAFLKVSPKPVFKFLLPVLVPSIDQSRTRADFGLPDRFTFLFSFDFLSVLERKNPVGLIQAFSQAFAPSEGPVLVIKTINGDKRTLEMEKLKYAMRGRPDVILKDGYLPALENATLTALADCYVSLHRSEGFGLTIAEAMARGKPAIATAYSGNLEFMTETNSYLCPFRRGEVGPEREPYPAASHWSEPDVNAAARLLRHVYTHQDEARDKGKRAAEDMRALHAPEIAGPIILDRLTKIRRRRATSHRVRTIAFYEDRLEELEGKTMRAADLLHRP